MQQNLPWIIALMAVALLVPAVWLALLQRKAAASNPLPTEWGLTARPVFSTDERRAYRQLREALPHHIVLSKLPLVRFCEPKDPHQVRYWYDMLGSIHVTFAVCSANGRVLAALDLTGGRGTLSRSMLIKQAVLGACRVRYLRCTVDHLPSIPELQLLVPQVPASSPGPQPAPAIFRARDSLSSAVASRRRERTTLWQDSGFFHDSFFAPDTRGDATSSELSATGDSGRATALSIQGSPAESPVDASGDSIPLRHSSQVRH